MDALANRVTWCSFQSSQRVFKLVALLVPGFPSLDAKLYSPGETRRFERKKSELRRTKCRYSRFLICNSYFSPCQFVTVDLKCPRPSRRRRRGQRKLTRSLSRNHLKRATGTPSAIRFGECFYRRWKARPLPR